MQSGRQSGLRLLSLLRDEELIMAARQAAAQLIQDDPELTAHPELARLAVDLLDEQRAQFLDKV
jgi:ATP-dependent DNA helicase RecG